MHIKPNKVSMQFFYSLVVGGIAFLFDFGILFFLTSIFGIHYLFSVAIAFVFGVLVNHMLSIRFVFPYRKLENKKLEFLIFIFIGVVGLLLNEVIIYFSVEFLGIHYLFSKIVATGVVFMWNFGVRKYILF